MSLKSSLSDLYWSSNPTHTELDWTAKNEMKDFSVHMSTIEDKLSCNYDSWNKSHEYITLIGRTIKDFVWIFKTIDSKTFT